MRSAVAPAHAAEVRRRMSSLEATLGELRDELDAVRRGELLDRLVLDAHTLRGSAAALGLGELRELAAGLERIAGRLLEQPDALEEDVVDALRQAVAAAELPDAADVVEAPSPGTGPRTVLHVDDNPADRRLLAVLLGRDARFRLVSAENGASALRLAREEAPAVILLDLRLPDMTGEQVIEALRADPATASIPVVVASADAMPETGRRLAALGASAFASKPFDFAALVDLLATA